MLNYKDIHMNYQLQKYYVIQIEPFENYKQISIQKKFQNYGKKMLIQILNSDFV